MTYILLQHQIIQYEQGKSEQSLCVHCSSVKCERSIMVDKYRLAGVCFLLFVQTF